MNATTDARAPTAPGASEGTRFAVLLALSLSHGANDFVQSLVSAIYPILKASFALDFAQIGLITLAFQLTASLLQPFVGVYTDRKALVYALPAGMVFTFSGLALLAEAPNFAGLIGAASLIGVGSSIFHPEAARLARLASGGRHGMAQSLFQVGGAVGAAVGPLVAAFIVAPNGRQSLLWLTIAPLAATPLLVLIGHWHNQWIGAARLRPKPAPRDRSLPPKRIAGAIFILLALIFSKYFYLASLGNYLTFYLIAKFQVQVQTAQAFLFLFFGAAALGGFIGGPIGDRIGRRNVIVGSIVGVLPFTLLLPYANLLFTGILIVVIGVILSSAFPAIIVYAQELTPRNIGAVSGLFYGFAFGMGGLGAAALGHLSDLTNIAFVFRLTAFLPAIGLFAVFLPKSPRQG